MAAGHLNQRVTFQRLQAGADGYGNVSTSWADVLTVWADVRETIGKERVDAGRVESSQTATVRLRRSTESLALGVADRMIFNGFVWNIRSIASVARNREMLDILVEAGVAT